MTDIQDKIETLQRRIAIRRKNKQSCEALFVEMRKLRVIQIKREIRADRRKAA
jgi:hypothetical protein